MSTSNNMGFQGSDQAPQAPPMPEAPKPGIGTKILGALSGGMSTPSYSIDPQTGTMQTTQTPTKPGQMFKNMLAGMLSGFAAGAGAEPGKAVAAGAQDYTDRAKLEDAQKRQQAQQQFADQQKATQTDTAAKQAQAELVKSGLEQAKLSFDLASKRQQLSEEQLAKSDAYNNAVKNTPGAKVYGSYTDWANFLQTLTPNEQTELTQSKAKGEIQVLNTYDDEGKVNGVQVYKIPQTYLQTPTKEDWQYVQDVADPKTGAIKSQNITVPAGAMTYAQKMDVLGKNLRPLATLQKGQQSDQTKIIVTGMNNETAMKKDAADNATKLQVARVNAGTGMMTLPDGGTLNVNGPVGQQALRESAGNKALDTAAWTYLETGGKTLPAMGYGKQGYQYRQQVMARVGQLELQNNIDPADVGAIGANIAANKSSLVKVSQSQAMMKVFEDTLDNNMKTASELNQKYSRTNMSFANRVIEHIKKGTGDPDVAAFVLQMGAIAPEFGKIMSGATSASGATVSSTKDAEGLINRQLSSGQIEGLFKYMRRDMANRNDAANAEKKELLFGTRGKGQNEVVTGQSNGPAVGFVKDGWQFKGGNPSDHANWEQVKK